MEVIRTDAQVIAASIRNPEAFASVFDRHAEVLAKYLVRRVGSADGESLLGELFRIAFESRDRFDTNYSDARPWLYGIGSKLVMKHFRSRERGRTALVRLASQSSSTEVPFDEQVTENSHWIALWQCVAPAIDDLPDRDREVVMLYVFSGLSYVEIAEALEIPAGTVRSRLNRVRVAMRQLAATQAALQPISGTTTGETSHE